MVRPSSDRSSVLSADSWPFIVNQSSTAVLISESRSVVEAEKAVLDSSAYPASRRISRRYPDWRRQCMAAHARLLPTEVAATSDGVCPTEHGASRRFDRADVARRPLTWRPSVNCFGMRPRPKGALRKGAGSAPSRVAMLYSICPWANLVPNIEWMTVAAARRARLHRPLPR